MFTGIIKEIGTLIATSAQLADTCDAPALADSYNSAHAGTIALTFQAPSAAQGAKFGDSIAIDGVCLTVTSLEPDGHFTVDVMPETLRVTTLGRLREGDRVNVEPAVSATERLDGHIVQGHVDGTAQVISRTDGERWTDLRFRVPKGLARYIASKGSITVSGTSLTVTDVGDDWFGVSLIPTTLEGTILGAIQEGALVNIEVDVIAKYVERLLGCGASEGVRHD